MDRLEIALVAAGTALAACVALELTLRWVLRRFGADHALTPGTRLHLRLDPAVNPKMSGEVRFEVSPDGVRTLGGRRPNKGTRRILIGGGSAAEGYLLDWPDTWGGRLQAWLSALEPPEVVGGGPFHVSSVGRSRTGSVGLGMIFRSLLRRYGPLDGIVILVGATDLVDWLEDGAPADWKPRDVLASDVFPQRSDTRFGWSLSRSATKEALKRLRNRWLPPIAIRENAGATLAKVRAKRAAALEIIQEVPEPAVMLARFRQHFESLLSDALAHARQVLVVRQPCFWKRQFTADERAQFWSFAVGNPYHTATTRYFDLQLVGRLMETVNDEAEFIANRLGAKTVDLMPHLERSRETYYDFMHFTPLGADQIGEVVARAYLDLPPREPRYGQSGPID